MPNWGGVLNPYILDGTWFNGDACGQSCIKDCSCTEICEVTLPGPVDSIVSVKLDGVTLGPDEYRVDNYRKLVRLHSTTVVTDFIRLGTSANTIFDPANVWCDLTPAPSSTTDTGPVGMDGCYPSLANNPGFVWNSASEVQATYSADSPDSTTMSFLDSDNSTYSFANIPANQVVPAGTTVVSEKRADGKRMRFTVVSGTVTKYFNTPYWFVVQPGATIRAERVVEAPACWPTCQDMTKPVTEVGTWAVTYLKKGRRVPEAGLWAAGLLACELIKACTLGEECCALPGNVTSVSREGVSIDFEKLNLAIGGNKGRTGIPEVDLWLQTVNPYNVSGRSRAYSPDRPPMRRTTWPCADD